MVRTSKQTGELRLRWAAADAWRVEVVQADPVVEFADEFLEALASENRADVSMGDGILTIRGVNRTVSYGLGEREIALMTTLGYLSDAACQI
jgi:hypothetical protein